MFWIGAGLRSLPCTCHGQSNSNYRNVKRFGSSCPHNSMLTSKRPWAQGICRSHVSQSHLVLESRSGQIGGASRSKLNLASCCSCCQSYLSWYLGCLPAPPPADEKQPLWSGPPAAGAGTPPLKISPLSAASPHSGHRSRRRMGRSTAAHALAWVDPQGWGAGWPTGCCWWSHWRTGPGPTASRAGKSPYLPSLLLSSFTAEIQFQGESV